MALSGTDERELVSAVHAGHEEVPRWNTFLARLRGRTRAARAILSFTRAAPPARYVAADAAADVRDAALLDRAEGVATAALHRMRQQRVYQLAELGGGEHPAIEAPVRGRVLCLGEGGRTTASLMVLRARADFGAADGALLANLAPHFAIALRNLAALEGERLRARVCGTLLARAGIAWAIVDADDAVLAAAGRSEADVIDPTPLPRWTGDAADGRAEAIELPLRVPLLTRTPTTVTALGEAARWSDRALQLLATRYHLSASEARLAAALAGGRAIAEAAEDLGLTVETARTYSKRLYEKSGVRGQAELVRLMLTSAARLV